MLEVMLFSGVVVFEVVDFGKIVLIVDVINEGLFFDEKCKELEVNGFKCMGFKFVIKYLLLVILFKVGLVELFGLFKC